MKIKLCMAVSIAIIIVLFTTGMQPTTSIGSTSDNNSAQTKNATKHHSNGTWQTVLMEDGTECEGLVFDSIEDAKQEAERIGCSGYHEHHKEDGTIIYMPCSLGEPPVK
tara:strand:+ start:853 stop:1179 length:327 start_codon:yes stop_codon:yes gene_type:complete